MAAGSVTVTGQLLRSLRDVNAVYEVQNVVTDLVHLVEIRHLQAKNRDAEEFTVVSRAVCLKLLKNIDEAQRDRAALRNDNISIKNKARAVREKFAVEITQVLRDNRQLNDVKMALRENSTKSQELYAKIKELEEENARLKLQLNADKPETVAPKKFVGMGVLFADAPDKMILEIFAFLNTPEVLNIAQLNRYLFWRINGLFDMNSELVEETWSHKPVCLGGTPSESEGTMGKKEQSGTTSGSSNTSNQDTSAQQSSSAAELKEMANALTKKLTPAEMTAIFAWNSKLNTVSRELSVVNTEKDELKQKLQVVVTISLGDDILVVSC
jgi:hypothetical protein